MILMKIRALGALAKDWVEIAKKWVEIARPFLFSSFLLTVFLENIALLKGVVIY
jgi:hypothetical protein